MPMYTGGWNEASESLEERNRREQELLLRVGPHEGDDEPEVAYADRNGKYMRQQGVTLPKM